MDLLEPPGRLPRPGARGQDPQPGDAAGADPARLRLPGPRRADRHRAGHHPVRDRARGRPAGLEGHRPGRRPGDRPGGAERPDRRADPGQDDGGHRGPQRPPQHGPAGRRHRRRARAVPGVPHPAVPGQGRQGRPAGLRPRRDAAPADGRPHRHGQVGLPERDDPVDPDDQAARRGQGDPDRPQEGRALAVQADPPPDAPGRRRHEEGRVAAGLGLREDGRALRVPASGRGAEHLSRTTSSGPRRSTRGSRPRTTPSGSGSRPTCRTSSSWWTSWPR